MITGFYPSLDEYWGSGHDQKAYGVNADRKMTPIGIMGTPSAH
jgi:hypothetical protein